MSNWIRPVAPADVEDGRPYFIGLPPKWKYGTWAFWSEWLNGKRAWSEKPGIALQYEGGEELRKLLTEKGVMAVEVPKDADTRWRKRRSRRLGPTR
jgi:hypothetical protein